MSFSFFGGRGKKKPVTFTLPWYFFNQAYSCYFEASCFQVFGTRFSHPERVSAEAEKLHAHILRDQRFVRSTAFDLNHEGKMDELCRLLHRMRSTFARNSALKDQLQSHSGLVNDETIYSSLFYFFLCTTKYRKRSTDAGFSDTDFFPTCRHILLKSST